MPYEEDFLQGYIEGCLTSLSPYVGGVYDKMSTDYQVYTQQTVSEFTKSRSWLVTSTMFIALLSSEEVVDLHPWQVKILVSNKWWYFVYEDVSSLSCYDTFNLKAFDFSQFVHHWPQ